MSSASTFNGAAPPSGSAQRSLSGPATLALARPDLPLFIALLLLLTIAVLLGGASARAPLSQMIISLCALPALWLASVRLLSVPGSLRAALVPLLLIGGVVAVPLIQLVPLPVSVWSQLPGRSAIEGDLELAGAVSRWRPLTLDPQTTGSSTLWLIAPCSVMLSMIALGRGARRLTAFWLLALCLGSLLLGLGQVIEGPEGPLSFYGPNPARVGPGVFANPNHQASLMLLGIPLAVGCLAQLAVRRALSAFFCLAILAVLIGGMGISGSRAAFVLLPVAVVGSLLVFVTSKPTAAWAGPAFGIASLLALASLILFGAASFFEELHSPISSDLRFKLAPEIARVAASYMPFGSGIGTFDPVYRMAERSSLITTVYMNEAHDEYLQIWLEAGLLGIVVLTLLVTWFVHRTVKHWRRMAPVEAAAAMMVVLLLLHSLVDYPMRTLALACVFAWSLGMVSRSGVS